MKTETTSEPGRPFTGRTLTAPRITLETENKIKAVAARMKTGKAEALEAIVDAAKLSDFPRG